MIDMGEVIALLHVGDFDELTRRGVQISSGVLERTEGWAKPAFHGKRAHYFTQLSADAIGKHGRCRAWKSVCGAETTTHDKAPMFGMGSWERCKVCLTIRNVARSRDATQNTHNENVSRHAGGD